MSRRDADGHASTAWSRSTLDEASIGRSEPDVEHERAVAIYDLLEDNYVRARSGHDGGPYALRSAHHRATGWCSTSGAPTARR